MWRMMQVGTSNCVPHMAHDAVKVLIHIWNKLKTMSILPKSVSILYQFYFKFNFCYKQITNKLQKNSTFAILDIIITTNISEFIF